MALTGQSQTFKMKVEQAAQNEKTIQGIPAKQLTALPGGTVDLHPAQKTAALANCTDLVDFTGSVLGNYVSVGSNTNSSTSWEKGVFQVYPAYTGFVTGIEFAAGKYNSAPNPKVYIGIFDLTGNAPDINNQFPTPVPFLTITNTTNAMLSYTFASPVPVTNGFAIGLYTLGQDSVKIPASPLIASTAPYYSYIYNSLGNMYTFNTYFGVNANIIARPVITTSVNPTWLTAKTSTGCGTPVVYNFTNTTAASPSYSANVVINPSGITRSLDFGDGSPVVNSFPTSVFSPVTHSYTALGTYTASYTQTYVGWTNSCAVSNTLEVTVDNPLPAFTYNTNGLTVMFTNTSQNLSTYSWNFGDLSTSTQTDPTHTFTSPGTYIVELEGTAPCGKVRYSLSIVVSGETGIKEYKGINNSVSLFPNPAAATLQITNTKTSNELDSKVEIFNSAGAIVKVIGSADFSSGHTELNVSDLSKGIYFIKIKSKEGDIVKSFVKE